MRSKAQNQYHQKEENAHQSVDAQFLHDDGPRKEEHRLDVEHQEEDGEEVVTHLELHPRTSARRDAALVSLALLGVVRTRRHGAGDAQRDCDQRNGRKDDDHQ